MSVCGSSSTMGLVCGIGTGVYIVTLHNCISGAVECGTVAERHRFPRDGIL